MMLIVRKPFGDLDDKITGRTTCSFNVLSGIVVTTLDPNYFGIGN